MRKQVLISSAVALLVFGGYVFGPVASSNMRYANAGSDKDIRCEASQQIAQEWSNLGFSSQYRKWRDRAALNCLSAGYANSVEQRLEPDR